MGGLPTNFCFINFWFKQDYSIIQDVQNHLIIHDNSLNLLAVLLLVNNLI
jgi:hypothetical protein